LNAIYITPRRININEINIDKLKSLNVPIAKIHTVHMGGNEASKADSDLAKGFETQLLLVRDARVKLICTLKWD